MKDCFLHWSVKLRWWEDLNEIIQQSLLPSPPFVSFDVSGTGGVISTTNLLEQSTYYREAHGLTLLPLSSSILYH